jgi:hypothetical protein
VITPQVELEGKPGVGDHARHRDPSEPQGGARHPSGPGAGADARGNWVAELLHLKGVGRESSVVLVAPHTDSPKSASYAVAQEKDSGADDDGIRKGADMALALEATRNVLARAEIPATVVVAGSPLQAALTFRRRRKVIRSTPTGGVVTYEVEEEVG